MIPARDYRPDIDGLRAVAVLGVLLFHAGLGCSGGYVGVDVFFVISGFLITGLVLKEQRADRFSLTTFWERRIRRILPALAVVVAITLAVGTALLFPSELVELVKSAMAQLALGANFYFWRNAGYFDAPAELQLLLHTWSLAVEEQFYLGFPLLLILCRRLSRRQLQAVLSTILVVSLALSVWGTYSHPTATFYLLPSRAWELLVGALLATIATDSRLPRWLAESLSWAGAAAIAVAFFAYGSTTRFPGANALLPCMGAALLIWSNIGERTSAGKLLSLSPIVAIGLMSYSLYLWHWPILVFIRYRVSDAPALDIRLAAIAASFMLAGLSWRFVETPFRRRSKDARQRTVFAFGFAVTAGLFLTSVVIWRLHGLPERFPDDIIRFAEQNDFPSEFETDRVEQIEADELPIVGQANGAEAAFLIWGDSHAPPVAAAVRDVVAKYGVWGYVAANPGITPVLGTWRPQAGKEAVKRNQAVLDFVRRKGIKTVILASDWFVNTHPRANGSLDSLIVEAENESIDPHNAMEILRRGLRMTVSELQRAGADVWIMRQVPMQRDLPSQLAFDAWLQNHEPPRFGVKLAEHVRTHAALNRIFSDLEREGVRVLDPTEVCFNPSHQSFIAASGRSYYWDRTHLSVVGSEQMLSHLFGPVIEQIAHPGLSAIDRRIPASTKRD
jgi:peptidoglycan/LPS O-acetylase OafA/YrhL